MVEVVGRLLAFGEPFTAGAVDNEHIEPAVMVVIVEGDAGAVGLDDVAFDTVFPENYGMNEARALGHILKLNVPRPAGKFRARGRAHAAAPNALPERSGTPAEREAGGA